MHFHRRSFRTPLLIALVLFATAALAACGDDDGGSSSSPTGDSGASTETASAGLAKAEAEVEKLTEPTKTFTPPGPPINASALRGKTIWYVPISASIPVLAVEEGGMKEAAKSVGLSFQVCDGQFTPAAASSCIERAVNASAAGIILDSVEPHTVAPSLAKAATRDIPVMGFQLEGTESDSIRFISGGDLESHVAAMYYIIAHSEGKANILAASTEGAKAAEEQMAAAEQVIEENCSECSFAKAEVTASGIQKMPSAVSSALLQNPDVNYGFPQYDFFAPLFLRGMQQAGRSSGITVVSTNAALAQMKEVASGGTQVADIGANRNYLGWEAVDGLLRMALDKPAPEDVTVPIRIFDESNIGDLDLTESAGMSGEWWGSTDYKAEFPKLWGAG